MKPYILLFFCIFVPIFAKHGSRTKPWSKKWVTSTTFSTATSLKSIVMTTAAPKPTPAIIIEPSLMHTCILDQNVTDSCLEKYNKSAAQETSADVCRNAQIAIECINKILSTKCNASVAMDVLKTASLTMTNVNINDPTCRNLTDYMRRAGDDFIRHGVESSNNAVVLPPSGDLCVLKHKTSIDNCFTKQMRDINTNLKGVANGKDAANVCSKLLIGMECMRKVLGDNCGADQADKTIQGTTLKQTDLDMNIPECQQLDVYIKLGASENKGSADFAKIQYIGSLATLVILFTSIAMNV